MTFIRKLLVSTLAVALLAAPVAAQDSAAASDRKVDRALREARKAGDTTPKRVIVSVLPGYREQIRKALAAHGDAISAESPLVNAIMAVVHDSDIEELAAHPWVRSIGEDSLVFAGDAGRRSEEGQGRRSLQTVSKASSSTKGAPRLASTLRSTLGLPKFPSYSTPVGRGVGVAVIDSGIAPNLDFALRIAGFYDFTKGGISVAPFDEYGHGTHVAGLIGSNGLLSSFELMGIAPAVKLFGLKVLDAKGEGRTSDVIKALEFVVANKSRLGIDIVNLSLGHPIYAPAKDDMLVQAVERASDAGLIVVTSAGNFGAKPGTGSAGYSGITSPGNAPSALTVGSVDTRGTVEREDDGVARYSSRGPTWFDGFSKPDLVAPGHLLTSDSAVSAALYDLLKHNRRGSSGKDRGKFLELSGTSMAAAVTSGVVALLIDVNKDADHLSARPLTPNLIKAMLEFSAIPLAKADALTQGAGGLNAAGAISLASAIDTSARAGDWWLRSGVSPYSYIGGKQSSWSQRVIWGDDVLTGSLLYRNLPSWSVTAQWGDDNIVWGTFANVLDDNIVWGTVQVWASNIVWPNRMVGQIDDDDNIVWGTDDDNIVWGTLDFDNIVWGTFYDDNIVWGTWEDDNIVWGTTFADGDNIVWGTNYDDIVWGTDDDNIVWGTDDNIVWGTSLGVLGGAKSNGKVGR